MNEIIEGIELYRNFGEGFDKKEVKRAIKLAREDERQKVAEEIFREFEIIQMEEQVNFLYTNNPIHRRYNKLKQKFLNHSPEKSMNSNPLSNVGTVKVTGEEDVDGHRGLRHTALDTNNINEHDKNCGCGEK